MTNNERLQYRVSQACGSFERLEYWLYKYIDGEVNVEEVLRIKEQLKKDLGKAVGLTDYTARFEFSIEE